MRSVRRTFTDFIPSAVGIALLAVLAMLYKLSPETYQRVLNALDIPAFRFPFLDTEFVFTMKECWDKGVDIYAQIPCDTIPENRMPYSPLWPRLPIPTDKDSFRVPVGVVAAVAFLSSIVCLPPSAKSVREVTIILAATLSPMVAFALERGNVDIWIYLSLVLAAAMLRQKTASRLIAYGILLFVSLLKYYPLVTLVVALRERIRLFLFIAAMTVLVVAAFGVLMHDEIVRSLANVQTGDPSGPWIGVINLAKYASARLLEPRGFSPETIATATLLMRFALTGLIVVGAWVISARPVLAVAFLRLQETPKNWLVIGCAVMAGCYLMGQSLNYRGVFLLPVLSGLLVLTRNETTSMRQFLLSTSYLIIGLMWVDAARAWVTIGVEDPGTLPALARRMLWFTREFGWLLLCQFMLGILLIFIQQSRCWVELLGKFQPGH